MKKDIHPEYHEITVQMTDGSTFTTRSTYGACWTAADSLPSSTSVSRASASSPNKTAEILRI